MAPGRCANTAAGARGWLLAATPVQRSRTDARTRRTRPRGGNQRITGLPCVMSSQKRPMTTTRRREPMSTATTSKVRTALVIGGGIAGPVVPTALLKAGIQATVYEAYPTLAEGIGGGLALAPNGLAALGLIGADDAVRALATPVTGTVMAIGGHARRLPSLAGVEPLQVIGRGDLHRILHDRAVESGVRFEYGKRLVAVDEAPDSVTARFADGTAATADVLI